MTELREDIDRVIDETLQSMTLGEPRRVSAASVRAALEPRRRSSIPAWFAIAAVLVMGFLVSLRRVALPLATSQVAVARPTPGEMMPVSGASENETVPAAADPVRRTVRTAASRPALSWYEPVYAGLPRLLIAPIDSPEPLSPPPIDTDALEISSIEIVPLNVSTLPNEQTNPNKEPSK